MPINPYFSMPENITVDDDMKRAALTNALMQFGVAITQPQQGKNSWHKLLNAIPSALQQGMGGYTQGLMGTAQTRQAQNESKVDTMHKQAMTKNYDELSQDRAWERQQKEQGEAMLNEMVNMPGVLDTVSKHTKIPVEYYKKYPRALVNAIEKMGTKAEEIMVDVPMFGQKIPVSQAKDFMFKEKEADVDVPMLGQKVLLSQLKEFMFKPEKGEEEKWADWGYGKKRNLKTGEIQKVDTAPKGSGGGGAKEDLTSKRQYLAKKQKAFETYQKETKGLSTMENSWNPWTVKDAKTKKAEATQRYKDLLAELDETYSDVINIKETGNKKQTGQSKSKPDPLGIR